VSIGAKSAFWRRAFLRAFSSTYFQRRVKTTEGDFDAYVSPNSGLRVLSVRGVTIDPVHQRFIHDWIDVDGTVWDIGCNLGLFAFAAALKASKGRVYGFEPDFELATNLIRSLRLPRNKNSQVSIFPTAISNTDGIANFQVSKFSRALNKLEGVAKWSDKHVATAELRPVITMRVDTLSRSLCPPSAMKIDVEGAEMEVLEGAAETVVKHRPAILIEVPSELYEPIQTFFDGLDYVLLDGATDDLSPLKEPVWDTIALPREKWASARHRGKVFNCE
jgi:FkbM family methyltransferase